MMYLDLQELPHLFARYRLWSHRPPALMSFRRRDHLGDPNADLDTAVRDLVEQRTGRRPNGPIRLLTQLACLGYRFNPLSLYYCFNEDETLAAVVAEVNNTPWGEQHCYVLDARESTGHGPWLRFERDKEFHVSPFMPMDMDYDWRFSMPLQRLAVHMINYRHGDRVFDATLALQRREIGHASLAGLLLRFPLMSARIVMAIYTQALFLWLKRLPFYPHPASSGDGP